MTRDNRIRRLAIRAYQNLEIARAIVFEQEQAVEDCTEPDCIDLDWCSACSALISNLEGEVYPDLHRFEAELARYGWCCLACDQVYHIDELSRGYCRQCIAAGNADYDGEGEDDDEER